VRGPVNTAGARKEFSDLFRSVRANMIRVDMPSSIQAPDLTPSPLGEWIKGTRDVIQAAQ
jgi:hypothetical protein